MLRKIVRFYELRYVPKNDPRRLGRYEGEFWSDLGEKVATLQPADRRIPVRGVEVYGEHRQGGQPAISYFYVGRLRRRAEWPDAVDSQTGDISDLRVSNVGAELVDPAYVVPFGGNNQIAVLAMSAGSPRVSMLESWFTALTGENSEIDHYSLIPVWNRRVNERLAQANGATLFRVRIDPTKQIPGSGGGQIGDAARAAKQVSSETTVELGWTLGHRKGSPETTDDLLEAARWVRNDWVDSAKVSLQLPDGERLRRRQYDLVKEEFTSTQRFEIVGSEPASEQSVLSGIQQAIDEFRTEFS